MRSTAKSLSGALCGGVAVLGLLASAGAAFAQIDSGSLRYRNYESRGTASPYLRLLDEEAIGLPTYWLDVRPQFDQQDLARAQSRRLEQLDWTVNQLNSGPYGRLPVGVPSLATPWGQQPNVWHDPRALTSAPLVPTVPGPAASAPELPVLGWKGTYWSGTDWTSQQGPLPPARFMEHSRFFPSFSYGKIDHPHFRD